MKLAQIQRNGERHFGLVEDGLIRLIGTTVASDERDLDTFRDLVSSWDPQRLSNSAEAAIPLTEVQCLAPISSPEKIICVGRNYADHAAEMGSEVKELPVIFNKFPGAIADPDSAIPLPEISDSIDYEAELVVVIGREGRFIRQADAMDHVFGYCCGNDVSARDWQKGKPGGQWLLGKTFDSFAPIGPWIVTRDEVNPDDLAISLTLNGQTMQQDNTSNLMFKIDFLIAHLSQFTTLTPGDLLFTGTPAGVGAGRKPPLFIQPGDETVVEISGLGELRNTYIAAK